MFGSLSEKMSDISSYARNAAAQATTLVAGSELEKKLRNESAVKLGVRDYGRVKDHADWGCDVALWEAIRQKEPLIKLVQKGDEEYGRKRIARMRELVASGA